MSLLTEINSDLKQAMLDKDVLTRDTIRMLISEIKRFEIDNKAEAGEELSLIHISEHTRQPII